MSFSKETGSTEPVHSWSVYVSCVRWSDGSTTIHMPQSQGGADCFFPRFTDMSLVPSEIFGSCFFNPISTPELDTVPAVNNDHASAAHAGSGGGVLEKNDSELGTVLNSPTEYLSPILACSDGNNLKNEYLVLGDVYPPTTLKIFGRDFLHHVLITATEYNYPRPTILNNEESQETEPEPDDTASTSAREDLEFDPVPASTIDNKFAYSGGEILDLVLDESPPAIHKESGHSTGSRKEREDGRLGLTWKTDNASPKPSGCRKRERETCAICKRRYCDLKRHMRRNHGDSKGVRGLCSAFPAK